MLSFSTRSVFSFQRFSALFLALLVLTMISSAPAQVLTGTLTGTVSDPTDAVVPNASVTAVDVNSGKVYKANTDAAGVYTFTSLPNSTYKLTVEHPGFSKTEVDKVMVDVSQTSRINVKLEVARTGTEVIV